MPGLADGAVACVRPSPVRAPPDESQPGRIIDGSCANQRQPAGSQQYRGRLQRHHPGAAGGEPQRSRGTYRGPAGHQRGREDHHPAGHQRTAQTRKRVYPRRLYQVQWSGYHQPPGHPRGARGGGHGARGTPRIQTPDRGREHPGGLHHPQGRRSRDSSGPCPDVQAFFRAFPR